MDNSLLNEVLRGTSFALFDGAMGTMLVRAGLAAGELPELLCLEQPQKIASIHRSYVQAGSQFVTTNTFGANRLKLGDAADVAQVFQAAVRCARDAGAPFVAADIGPTGELIAPMGELSFSDAYDLFAEQARAAQAAGADVVIVETMADIVEAVAAVLAVKQNCDLPLLATMTFTAAGRTFLGCEPASSALALALLGVDALGVNCSAGPADLQPVVERMLDVAPCPVIVQANAGLPEVSGGETKYTLAPADYARAVEPMIRAGATIVGGCCGTDPDYIAALSEALGTLEVAQRSITMDDARARAQEVAQGDGRDAEVLQMILDAHNASALKDELDEEYALD